MPLPLLFKFQITTKTSKPPSKPSSEHNSLGSGSNSKNTSQSRSGRRSPQSYSRKTKRSPSQPYNTYIVEPSDHSYKTYTAQPTPRTYEKHTSSRRRTSIRGPHETRYRYVDVSPEREAAHPHSSRGPFEKCPVSPLDTSRFEQPSPWSKPQPEIRRDEHGFSIREPSVSGSWKNGYKMSAFAPYDSDEFEHFEPRVKGRARSDAGSERSGRVDGITYRYVHGGDGEDSPESSLKRGHDDKLEMRKVRFSDE